MHSIQYWKLETISPLHIGSGAKLISGIDYLTERKQLGVLSPDKIFEASGLAEAGLCDRKKFISDWMKAIESSGSRQQINILGLQALKGRALADISSRIMTIVNQPEGKDVRAYIHSGTGNPLLPGSSLKGALRTALLSHFVQGKECRYLPKYRDQTGHPDSFFGADINHDKLRMLLISDGNFHPEATGCYQIRVLNRVGGRGSLEWIEQGEQARERKGSLFQYAEAIRPEQSCCVRVAMPRRIFELSAGKAELKNMEIKDDLFGVINQFTRRLLESEIELWKKEKYERRQLPDGCTYEEKIEELLTMTTTCSSGEAILRIGFGGGFNGITGGYQEDYFSPDAYKEILDYKIKPRDKSLFPKTRRYTSEGWPLGYVKISFLTDQEYIGESQKRSEEIFGFLNMQDTEDKPADLAPRYFEDKLKQGVEVEGEFLSAHPEDPRRKRFRAFIGKPGEEHEVELRYNADLKPGCRVRLKINDVHKKTGKILSVEFAGIIHS